MAACPRLVPDCDCDAECCKVADALALLSDDDLAREIADYLDAMQAQPELRAITWELLARKALAKIKEIRN